MLARHVDGRPGLVDEDQLLGIKIELTLEPFFAAFQDVGAVLLHGVAGFSAIDRVPGGKAPERGDAGVHTPALPASPATPPR